MTVAGSVHGQGRRFLLAALLAVFSLVCAWVGLMADYPRDIVPTNNRGVTVKVAADGWIEDGASFRFPNLASRGNRLQLTFAPWIPAGLAQLRFEASICGAPFSQFAVSPSQLSVELFLTGSCEPRELTLSTLTPFVPSAQDTRRLGGILRSARLVSPASLPIPSMRLLGMIAAAILASALVVWMLCGASFAAFAVPPLVGALLASNSQLLFENALHLWGVCAAIMVGFVLARRAPYPREEGGAEQRYLGVLAVLVLAAAALRFYGLDFGLPERYHPDEVPKVNALIQMRNNDSLNPRYFLHPSLLLYLSYFLNSVFQALGFGGSFEQSAHLAGRTVSALAGTASVFLVGIIGRGMFSPLVGLCSAAMLAFFPLHVTCSRYMKEDALLLFFILLTLVGTLHAVRADRPRRLLWAGLFAGFAASSKYSGMLACLIVAAAPFLKSNSLLRPDPKFLRWSFGALALMPLGFVICTPFSVLSPELFFTDFAREKRHMVRGHALAVDAWSQLWMYHLLRSVVPGVTLPSAVCAGIGLGFLAWKRELRGLLIIALVLLFYLPAEWVKAKPAPQPERYILPCLPFLAIAAGVVVERFRAAGWRIAALIVAGATVLFPMARSLQLASELYQDTRTRAGNWMREHLPRGAKVLITYYPRYSPEFETDEFDVVTLMQGNLMRQLDLDNLRRSGAQYLVLSSLFYERYFDPPLPEGAVFRERIRDVFRKVPVLARFSPQHGTYGFHNPVLVVFSLSEVDFGSLREGALEARTESIGSRINELSLNYVKR